MIKSKGQAGQTRIHWMVPPGLSGIQVQRESSARQSAGNRAHTGNALRHLLSSVDGRIDGVQLRWAGGDLEDWARNPEV
jgi:hypothetical protein